MKFATDNIFKALDGSLIGQDPLGGLSTGGTDWSSATLNPGVGRLGRSLGFGRLERDLAGNIISDAAQAAAARPGRGGSYAMRASAVLVADHTNATSQSVVSWDIAKCAGLQGHASWTQVQTLSPAATLNHHKLQGAFDGLSSVEAKTLGAAISQYSTASGDYSELFMRVLVLGDDLASGVTFNAPAGQQYNALLGTLWPQGAGNYVQLLTSFRRQNRQYYLVGNRTGAQLTGGVMRVLSAIQSANMRVDVGMAGRNSYSSDPMFSESIGLWVMGDRGYRVVTVPGGNVTAPTLADVVEALSWLRIISGDSAGYSAACCKFTEMLPFAGLSVSCTGTAPSDRCAIDFPPPARARLELICLLWGSWTNGAVHADLPDAYAAVFPAQNVVWADIVFPADRDVTPSGMQAQFLGLAEADINVALITGILSVGRVAGVLNELTRAELVHAFALTRDIALPIRLGNAAGVSLTADCLPVFGRGVFGNQMNYADSLAALGSPTAHAYAACGLSVRTHFAASNGLAVWNTCIDDPASQNAPAAPCKLRNISRPMEFYANLAVIAIVTRGVADEVESHVGRCEHIETLLAGGEVINVGAGPVLTLEQLEHCQLVFGDGVSTAVRTQLSLTRGARRMLWPALTTFCGATEHPSAYESHDGGWSMPISFSPLQREAATGLPPSAGGLISNMSICSHIARSHPDFLNAHIAESDLTRANKLHLSCALLSVHKQTLTVEYQIRYKQIELGTYDEYTIPFGVLRRVRCEGTVTADEVVTNVLWTRILPEQQIRVTAIGGLPCADLILGKSCAVLVRAPNWRSDPLHFGEEPGLTCVGLLAGHTAPMLGNWRSKVPVSPPLVANPLDLMRTIASAFTSGLSSSRRLLHIGGLAVAVPWVCVSPPAAPESEHVTILTNASGANRAFSALAVLAGLPTGALEVGNNMNNDRLQEQQQRRLPENAPAAQDATALLIMQQQIDTLSAKVLSYEAAALVSGGHVDAQKPGSISGLPSVVSGSTASTALTTLSGSGADGPE